MSLSDIIKQLGALRTPSARRLFLEMRQEAFRKTVTRLTGQLRDGTMNLDAWTTAMKGEIKSLHTTSAAVGRGDWRAMDARDWGRVGARVKREYAHLRKFVDDIAANDGKPFSGRHIVRSNLYGGSGRFSFERAHRTLQEEEQMTEYKWTLGIADHCTTCLDYSSQSWQIIGAFGNAYPGDGHSTICRSNCKCHYAYR